MSLSMSKYWYSSNCLHFSKRSVPCLFQKVIWCLYFKTFFTANDHYVVNLFEGEGFSTVDLLIKIGGFVKKNNIVSV
jgi:hypothetical protein